MNYYTLTNNVCNTSKHIKYHTTIIRCYCNSCNNLLINTVLVYYCMIIDLLLFSNNWSWRSPLHLVTCLVDQWISSGKREPLHQWVVLVIQQCGWMDWCTWVVAMRLEWDPTRSSVMIQSRIYGVLLSTLLIVILPLQH